MLLNRLEISFDSLLNRLGTLETAKIFVEFLFEFYWGRIGYEHVNHDRHTAITKKTKSRTKTTAYLSYT